ncbi:MAG: cytochrome c biogenesis protein ResB [Candidatus Aminicenantes bacterium]|nr:cytochrome c biogenesis protein ResB [Candidatus Aminicenantes bacterium]
MPDKKNQPVLGFARSLASLKLTVVFLILLGLLVIAGTVYQAENGIYAAQREIFGAWIIRLFGIVPLPGLLFISMLLFINLLAAVFFRLQYRWRRAGLLLVHYSLLLFIGGGFFIAVTAQEYFLTLREGESSNVAISVGAKETRLDQNQKKVILPIKIKLLDFEKTMHPGSGIPRSFSSRVEIIFANTRRRAVISMNRPLRYRDYTFYQSSYAEDGLGGESSTFSVVRNSGRWLPYIASALLFLGLAGHFLVMLAAALKKTRPGKVRP